MTHGKTYNKSPRRINHKATKSKTNTGTTALERSVEQTTGGGGGGLKHFYSYDTVQNPFYFKALYMSKVLSMQSTVALMAKINHCIDFKQAFYWWNSLFVFSMAMTP